MRSPSMAFRLTGFHQATSEPRTSRAACRLQGREWRKLECRARRCDAVGFLRCESENESPDWHDRGTDVSSDPPRRPYSNWSATHLSYRVSRRAQLSMEPGSEYDPTYETPHRTPRHFAAANKNSPTKTRYPQSISPSIGHSLIRHTGPASKHSHPGYGPCDESKETLCPSG
jgi:hypothetical protein